LFAEEAITLLQQFYVCGNPQGEIKVSQGCWALDCGPCLGPMPAARHKGWCWRQLLARAAAQMAECCTYETGVAHLLEIVLTATAMQHTGLLGTTSP
jgi:hypothetical protein